MATEFEVFSPFFNTAKYGPPTDAFIADVRRGIAVKGYDTSSYTPHYITIQGPQTTAFTANYVLKLPTSDGTNTQVLATDGAGQLFWQSGGGIYQVFHEDSKFNIYGGNDAGAQLSAGTATRNFLAGDDSGTALANGSYNVAIGDDSFSAASTGAGDSNNVAIGVGSLASASSTLSTQNINNVAMGYDSFGSLTTGANNIGIGRGVGSTLTSGSDNIILGGNVSNATDSGAIVIGFSISGGTNQTCIGVTAGATNANSLYLRHRASAVTANAAGWRVGDENELIDTVSSLRFKKDIRPWTPLNKNFDKIRPVVYKSRDDPSNRDYVGFIAEEMNEIYPEFIAYEKDWKTPRSVLYDRIVVLLVDEIQKLRKRVEMLEK